MEMSQRLAAGPVGVTAAPFMRSGPAAALDLALRAERAGYEQPAALDATLRAAAAAAVPAGKQDAS
jgi:hypothetical protein